MSLKHIARAILAVCQTWVAVAALEAQEDSLPDGLLAHWRLDEGRGETAADSGPGRHHATIHDAAWAEGRDGHGHALQFDGKRSWLDCGNADALNPSREFTIEAWIKPENSGHNMTVVAKGYRYDTPFNLCMGTFWHRDRLLLQSGAYQTHEVPIPLDKWSHVAAVCDGQRVGLFVVGKLQSVRPGASLKPSRNSVTIGKSVGAPLGGEFFKGLIQDVRLYDRVLPKYRLSGPTAQDINRAARQITTEGEWGTYEGFPSVCLLNSGRLLVAFYAGRDHMDWPHPALPRRGRICAVQSGDLGKTWSEPRTIVDGEAGERDPSLRQLKDGTVICSYFETIWHQRGRVCEVRTIRSFDNGSTWETRPAVVPSPWYSASQRAEALRLAGPPATEASNEHPVPDQYVAIHATSAPLIELDNGDLLLPTYGLYTSGKWQCGLSRSTDHGATWTQSHPIPRSEHLTEPAVIALPDGRLLCVMRANMASSVSTDQGRIWSTAASGTLPRGAAPDLLLTRDGVLLCGIREQPHSRTGVLLSTDLGDHWTQPQMIGFAGGAYPSFAELPDGRIFCVWYEEANGGNILQAIFTVDRQSGSIRLEPMR